MNRTFRSRRPAQPSRRPWRCECCSTLLGADGGLDMKLKYKEADYLITGDAYVVMATCRNCSTTNRRSRQEAPQ